MKKEVYSRYYGKIMLDSVVIFPNRSELVDFVSEIIEKDYRWYLNCLESKAFGNPKKIADIKERIGSEPQLIKKYAVSFLNEHVPQENEGKIKQFLINMKILSSSKPVVIDAEDSPAIYKFVLERLGRDTAVDKVFNSATRYTIIGTDTLTREIP